MKSFSRDLGRSITLIMVPALTEPSVSGTISLFMLINFRLKLTKRCWARASVEVEPPSTTQHVRIAVFASPCEYTFPPSSSVARKSEHSERTKICELNTYPLFSGKMSLNYTDAIRNIGINVEIRHQEKSSLSF